MTTPRPTKRSRHNRKFYLTRFRQLAKSGLEESAVVARLVEESGVSRHAVRHVLLESGLIRARHRPNGSSVAYATHRQEVGGYVVPIVKSAPTRTAAPDELSRLQEIERLYQQLSAAGQAYHRARLQ